MPRYRRVKPNIAREEQVSVEQRLPLLARLAALLGEEGKHTEQLKGLARRVQWLKTPLPLQGLQEFYKLVRELRSVYHNQK